MQRNLPPYGCTAQRQYKRFWDSACTEPSAFADTVNKGGFYRLHNLAAVSHHFLPCTGLTGKSTCQAGRAFCVLRLALPVELLLAPLQRCHQTWWYLIVERRDQKEVFYQKKNLSQKDCYWAKKKNKSKSRCISYLQRAAYLLCIVNILFRSKKYCGAMEN